MRILLDTHIVIWHLEGDLKLVPALRKAISDPENEIFISIATFWDISIKSSLSKLSLSMSLEDLVSVIEQSKAAILPISTRHALGVSKLPFHHRDPFDRMLIAQALSDNLSIVSSDRSFAAYGVELL